MSAILLLGGQPLHICFYKKRKNYAIRVHSSSQMTPENIDARSSAHVRKKKFRDPDPITRGPGFAFRHPLALPCHLGRYRFHVWENKRC